MGRFLHNPDDWITIEADEKNVMMVMLDEFLQYEPAYKGVPEPYIGLTYVQDQFHIVYTKNSQFAAALPWTAGDGYIANLATYQAAQAAKKKALKAVAAQAELDRSDKDIIHVMEIFINYLMANRIIPPGDVSEATIKLMQRRADLKAEIAASGKG